VLSQFQEAPETSLIEDAALVVLADFEVLFDVFVDASRKPVDDLADSLVDEALLGVFEILETSVPRNEVGVEKLYSSEVQTLLLD
jgi:hypothetical protein